MLVILKTFSSIVKAALNKKSLELLHVSIPDDNFCLEGWKVLMASLIPQDSSIKVPRDTDLRNESLSYLQPTTTYRDFRITVKYRLTGDISWTSELASHEIVQEAVEMFSSMLVANRTLTTLQIPTFTETDEQFLMVLGALRQNRYITKLILLPDVSRNFSRHPLL